MTKTALITGASKGIGAAAARHLAGEGWAVACLARSADALADLVSKITADGGKAIVIAADVADNKAIERAVAQTVDAFGSLDLLVNNAGLIDPIARIEHSSPVAWDRVVAVNLKGVYYGIRHALPAMKKAGGGTIINISSGAATGALEGWSHYCATKAAVLSLTKCTDKEERENGIRMIGLSPGTVATDMQVEIKESGINPVSQLDPSVHIPPEWVAKAIAYLTGPGGDAYRGEDFALRAPESRAALGLPTG
jgi:NAD(P)-dependent dehydrogenase (short-subunit alcohol dehydrogenase family)